MTNPIQSCARFTLPALGLAVPLAVPFAWGHSAGAGMAALGACAAAHGALAYATLRPNNTFFGPVVTRFVPDTTHDIQRAALASQPATRNPQPAASPVWLTIDDGPDPHDTPRLLDALDAHGARATFFLRGDRARARPALVEEIARRGHGIGNHTLNHPQATFWCAGPARIAREIGGCNEVLRAITGNLPRFFRAPVGHVNPFVHQAAQSCGGLRLIGWSARGFDGVDRHAADPVAVVARMLAGLRSGAIILAHEGRRGPGGEAVNVRAIEMLLGALAERGFQAVVPDEERLR